MGLDNKARRDFLKATAATIAYTLLPKTDLETMIAQDAPTADSGKDELTPTELYKKIATYFTTSATEFYTKAKDANKTKEAANLALKFDQENKEAKDLIQKVEKNKLKTNNKALKKAEENYEKNKEQAINDLYNTAIQKITDKESLKILDKIWEINPNSQKPLETRAEKLNWKKNEKGIYVPPVIWEAREKGKKTFNDATEGEKDEKKDDLEAILNIKPHRRTGNQVIARSPISDERAKQMHKAAEAGITYFSFRMEIEGNPFEGINRNDQYKEELKKEGGKVIYRVTEFYKAEDFDNYCEKVADKKGWNSSWGTLKESWKTWTDTSDKGLKIQPGHFHHFPLEKPIDDKIVHNIVRELLFNNSSRGYTSQGYPDFLEKGICYLMTAEILGTTSTVMVYTNNDKYEGWKEHTVKVETPDGIRSLIYEQVQQNKDPPFEYISTMTVDKMQPIHVAKSFSIIEFLMQNYKKELVALTTDNRTNSKTNFYDIKEENIVKTAFGKTPEELDKEWKSWVLENYIGYRQIKN